MIRAFLNSIKSDHPYVFPWIYVRIVRLVIFCKKDFNSDRPALALIILRDIERNAPRSIIPTAILI